MSKTERITIGERGYVQHEGLEVHIFRSDIDGRLVIQINSECFAEMDSSGMLSVLRILLNDDLLYECKPDTQRRGLERLDRYTMKQNAMFGDDDEWPWPDIKWHGSLRAVGAEHVLPSSDLQELNSAVDRVLRLMLDRQPHMHDEICRVAGKPGRPATEGLRRMRALRMLFKIRRDNVRGRLFSYTLVRPLTPEEIRMKARERAAEREFRRKARAQKRSMRDSNSV